MAPSHDEVRSLILAAEGRLSASFETDARRELSLLDDASSFLATMLGAMPVDAGKVEIDVDKAGVPSPGDVATVKLLALKYIGVRAVRVVRAARSALSTGYEPEARSYDRILLELLEHRRAVLEDESGKAALDWYKGKRREGVGARVKAMTSSNDLYKLLSQDAHGDPQPVIRIIDASTTKLEIGPRRTLATRATRVAHAAFCRTQAVTICARRRHHGQRVSPAGCTN